ncbi:unnamed protein product [Nesidiocoris tenuis]|uniref:Uncharacterized protein n=1 Tax=Nesidiocoris tenuis TaxID=355587 RepID=A0A6H5G5B6_9HEMI|nr:unnamed protein product [Nesidiocoris tenuis]
MAPIPQEWLRYTEADRATLWQGFYEFISFYGERREATSTWFELLPAVNKMGSLRKWSFHQPSNYFRCEKNGMPGRFESLHHEPYYRLRIRACITWRHISASIMSVAPFMIEVEEEFPGLEVLAHCFSAGSHLIIDCSNRRSPKGTRSTRLRSGQT